MKIAILCKSILLEKALHIFLKAYIVPFEKCDFLISDVKAKTKKPIFVINKKGHIGIPFSKESLMSALEEFHKNIPVVKKTPKITQKFPEKSPKKELAFAQTSFFKDESSFEAKLEIILRNFKDEILNLVKNHEKNF